MANEIEEKMAIYKLYEANKKLKKEKKVLEDKLSIAIEGLEVLLCDGNINGIPQKTLEAIKSFEELPQDKTIKQDKNEK